MIYRKLLAKVDLL